MYRYFWPFKSLTTCKETKISQRTVQDSIIASQDAYKRYDLKTKKRQIAMCDKLKKESETNVCHFKKTTKIKTFLKTESI